MNVHINCCTPQPRSKYDPAQLYHTSQKTAGLHQSFAPDFTPSADPWAEERGSPGQQLSSDKITSGAYPSPSPDSLPLEVFLKSISGPDRLKTKASRSKNNGLTPSLKAKKSFEATSQFGASIPVSGILHQFRLTCKAAAVGERPSEAEDSTTRPDNAASDGELTARPHPSGFPAENTTGGPVRGLNKVEPFVYACSTDDSYRSTARTNRLRRSSETTECDYTSAPGSCSSADSSELISVRRSGNLRCPTKTVKATRPNLHRFSEAEDTMCGSTRTETMGSDGESETSRCTSDCHQPQSVLRKGVRLELMRRTARDSIHSTANLGMVKHSIKRVHTRSNHKKRAVVLDAVDIALLPAARLPRKDDHSQGAAPTEEMNPSIQLNLLFVKAMLERLTPLNTMLVVAVPSWMRAESRCTLRHLFFDNDKIEPGIESGSLLSQQLSFMDDLDDQSINSNSGLVVHYMKGCVTEESTQCSSACVTSHSEEVWELTRLCLATDSLICTNNEAQFQILSDEKKNQEMRNRMLPYFQFGPSCQIVSDPRGRTGPSIREMISTRFSLF